MITPLAQLAVQIGRNLAQTAITQEVKNPYLFAALAPLVETFVQGVMGGWNTPASPLVPSKPAQSTPTSQCLTEEQISHLLQAYDAQQMQ